MFNKGFSSQDQCADMQWIRRASLSDIKKELQRVTKRLLHLIFCLHQLRDSWRSSINKKDNKAKYSALDASRRCLREGVTYLIPYPVELQVKINITPSFSWVLVSRGDAEIRSRVNEIFLVALFEISTFLCCHMIETPRRHHFWALWIVSFIWKFHFTNV